LAAVTFEPHPLSVLRPDRVPPRLAPVSLKQSLLADAGVDYLVILPPTRQVLDLSAETFWQILRDQVRVRHLVEGSSFNFGKNRGGTIDRLRQWAADSPVTLHVTPTLSVPLLDLQIVPVSSSVIRWLLSEGRVRDAAIGLGRAYALQGEVIRGHQRGRALGVPTANLGVADQLIPIDGVYAGRCTVDAQTYPAAVSIGTLPTFGETARQIEAHLVGFDGDLYGRTLLLEMTDWLREQRKFSGVEELKRQLARDISATIQRHSQDPARPIAQLA
jgi:riboflavin kinase/FMN adenylyltransferase